MSESETASLAGLRVVDLSRVLAGPWATQILGDLGAEVIKIERPGAGDDTRSWGPPFAESKDGSFRESAYFLATNRNKSSVTIDFSKPEGAELVRNLAARADVFVENFKVGSLEAHGLDYPQLKALNPGLIYCSITGFGRTGPYASRPGYDLLIQAMGGLMSVTGPPDDQPGAGPQKVGVAIADLMTGLYAAVGVLAALEHRRAVGVGQRVDLALFDTQAAMLANLAMNYLITGQTPRRMGNAHPSIAPYQDFPTADGPMVAAIGNDGQFTSFCRALGVEEWARDPRFATNPSRVANRELLIGKISQITATRKRDRLLAACEREGAPAGPVNSIAALFEDPHAVARGLRIEMAHEDLGSVPGLRNPLILSDTPVAYKKGPPRLGVDTERVLSAWLGLSRSQVEDLRAGGIV